MDTHPTHGKFDYVSWDPGTMYTISTNLPVERETTRTISPTCISFLPKPESHSHPRLESHNFDKTSKTIDEFHMKDLRGQLFSCEVCGYSSIYNEDLQNHKKTHPRDKADNIDPIFDYVVNKKYEPGISRQKKSNIRTLSKPYAAREGQLVYRHRATLKGGNKYKELLVIRDCDEKKRIIESIHTGSGDHLGIHRTRAKILEKYFWKYVGTDVRDYVSVCDSCSKVKPVHKIDVSELKESTDKTDIDFDEQNFDTVSQDRADNIDVDENNFSTSSPDIAENSYVYKHNFTTALQNKADKIDIDDFDINTTSKKEDNNSDADKHNSSTLLHEKAVNIDCIYDYVINKKYAPGISRKKKSNIRTLSKPYSAKEGQLVYRHRAKNKGGNEYREVLVIRDQDEQKRIIESIHTGSGDHLGIHKTRANILENFYWKNVGKDVRDFILMCNSCNIPKVKNIHKPVRKIDVGQCKSSTFSQDQADNIHFYEQNFYTASKNEAKKIDIEEKKINGHKYSTVSQGEVEEQNFCDASQDEADIIDDDNENLSIASENEPDIIDIDEGNVSIASEDESENIDVDEGDDIDDDEENVSIASEDNIDVDDHNSSTVQQNIVENIDLIYDYVVNNKIAPGSSKNKKSNIRTLSKPYTAREGQLVYRHRIKKGGNEFKEVLVIRDWNKQRNIIESIHMGSGKHLGIHSTRAKILETFYWKNVGKDVRAFISMCDSCSKVKPVHKSVTGSQDQTENIDFDDEQKMYITSQDTANNIDADENNFNTALHVGANNIDVDEHDFSMTSQDEGVNIDCIYDYVINKKYAPGISRKKKSNIRTLSKPYVAREGQLVYRHRAKIGGKTGNEHREVLVIRDRDKQRHIIESMHIGSGDHLGIHRTRAKILEKFYWKYVGKNVKDFVLACDRCKIQNAQSARKITMNMIFEFIVNNRYTFGMSKDDRGNVRKLSKTYVARTGQLYYLQKVKIGGHSGDEYRELLAICDRDEQRQIINNTHMGSEDTSVTTNSLISIMKNIHTCSKDSNSAHCLGTHLSIERTRTKILEKYFWNSLGQDVKEFISACDQCKKLYPARKSNAPVSEPCKVMVQIWG